ncbi:hypothetical protein P3S67_000827 [Capsicum chacoense]
MLPVRTTMQKHIFTVLPNLLQGEAQQANVVVYTLRSPSSSSSSSLNLAPIEDQVLAISTILELLSTVQSFPVEDIIAP